MTFTAKEILKNEDNYHIRSENIRKLQKVELKKELNEQELANVVRVNREIDNYQINMDILKKDYDNQLVGIESTYSQKLQTLRENLDLRLKVEIHEVEEGKITIRILHKGFFKEDTIACYELDIT